MRIYLDNCSYNRPYDDQKQIRINLESQAKSYIQKLIKSGELELVSSYVLEYENSRNRYLDRKKTIKQYIDNYASYYVGIAKRDVVEKMAADIMQTGIKEKDAAHIACAILAKCEYFISTDDRLLRYKTDKITLVTPGEFLRRTEAK